MFTKTEGVKRYSAILADFDKSLDEIKEAVWEKYRAGLHFKEIGKGEYFCRIYWRRKNHWVSSDATFLLRRSA